MAPRFITILPGSDLACWTNFWREGKDATRAFSFGAVLLLLLLKRVGGRRDTDNDDGLILGARNMLERRAPLQANRRAIVAADELFSMVLLDLAYRCQ